MIQLFRTLWLLLLLLQVNLHVDGQESRIDSTILSSDTVTIDGKLYRAIYKSGNILEIRNSDDSLTFRLEDCYSQFEFDDFDGDGNKDIRIHYLSNIPAVQDLILFDKTTRSFKPIIGFNNYPDPRSIQGTKYYFSYHRSGCADMDWDSDLFFIENFKIIKIGNISGLGCENSGVKNGIYIYKIEGENKITYNTLPIDTINKYKDSKWGFILEFWTKNYNSFDGRN